MTLENLHNAQKSASRHEPWVRKTWADRWDGEREAQSEREGRDPCQQAGPERKEKFMELGAAWGGLYSNHWDTGHGARTKNLPPTPSAGSRKYENEISHGREVKVEWHQVSEVFPRGLDSAPMESKLLCGEPAWRKRFQEPLTQASSPSHPEGCRGALETECVSKDSEQPRYC